MEIAAITYDTWIRKKIFSSPFILTFCSRLEEAQSLHTSSNLRQNWFACSTTYIFLQPIEFEETHFLL